AETPLIIAGGGVIRSDAQIVLRELAEDLSIPIAQTQAGKGSLLASHPLNVFAVGATGTQVGNWVAARADVILGVGTRYADFTTSSETAFNPNARFINLNIRYTDAKKEAGLDLVGDAKVTLEALRSAVRPLLETKNASSHIA